MFTFIATRRLACIGAANVPVAICANSRRYTVFTIFAVLAGYACIAFFTLDALNALFSSIAFFTLVSFVTFETREPFRLRANKTIVKGNLIRTFTVCTVRSTFARCSRVSFITFITFIAFFAFESGKLFGSKVGISERVSFVAFCTARRLACIRFTQIPIPVLSDCWCYAISTCRHVHGFPCSWFSVSVNGFNIYSLSDSRSCYTEGDVSAANTACLNLVNFGLQFVQFRKDLSPNISGGRFVRVRKIRCAHAAGHVRRGGCPDVSGCHADPHAAYTMQRRHRAGIALKKDFFALPFSATVICKNADFVVVGLPLVIKIKFYIVIAVAAHDAGRVYCACGFVADDDVYSRHKITSFRFTLSVCHWYPHVCPQ